MHRPHTLNLQDFSPGELELNTTIAQVTGTVCKRMMVVNSIENDKLISAIQVSEGRKENEHIVYKGQSIVEAIEAYNRLP